MPPGIRHVIFLLLGVSITMAQADVLILKNGDRLTGEVLNETEGVLKFKTSYAGILSIEWAEISEIRSDKPMTLLLDEDVVLTGFVVKNNGDTLLLKNEDHWTVRELTKKSVKEINPEHRLPGKGHKFSGMINIALKYDRGNNENDEIDLDGNLEFRRLYDRVRFYGEYDENRTKGITTKLKWLVTGAYDYFPRSDWSHVFDAQDWFIGLGFNLKKDEFAELNLRTRFGPHIGYQFYESKPLNLFVKGGFEAVKEEYTGGENNQYWANTWRLEFDRYLYKEKVQFYFVSDGLYGFASPDKTILENWTGFRFPFNTGFVASIEAETDYDSKPAEDAEKLSTSYRFKLGYKF